MPQTPPPVTETCTGRHTHLYFSERPQNPVKARRVPESLRCRSSDALASAPLTTEQGIGSGVGCAGGAIPVPAVAARVSAPPKAAQCLKDLGARLFRVISKPHSWWSQPAITGKPVPSALRSHADRLCAVMSNVVSQSPHRLSVVEHDGVPFICTSGVVVA